jgi:peroxiredoxin
MLQQGADAPEFSVNDHNGNTIQLKDYRGKKIVLWFYPKADTPGCTMEGQGFRDDFKKFEEKEKAEHHHALTQFLNLEKLRKIRCRQSPVFFHPL